MLRLAPSEIFARLIPEVLLLLLGTHAFSNTKINIKRYAISSIVLGLCVFLIRNLPINYGVHTILNIMMLTLVTISINKIDTIKGIRSSIITSIILFTCEGLNMIMLGMIFKDTVEQIISNTELKIIYGLPSLFSFGIIIIAYYCYLSKKGRIKDVEYRKDM